MEKKRKITLCLFQEKESEKTQCVRTIGFMTWVCSCYFYQRNKTAFFYGFSPNNYWKLSLVVLSSFHLKPVHLTLPLCLECISNYLGVLFLSSCHKTVPELVVVLSTTKPWAEIRKFRPFKVHFNVVKCSKDALDLKSQKFYCWNLRQCSEYVGGDI